MDVQKNLETSPNAAISKMIINKRFLVSKLIHETAHSNIYLGIDKKTNNKISIKIEEINNDFNKSKKMNQIIKNGTNYLSTILKKSIFRLVKGMPKQIWKGKLKSKEGDNLNNVIVTQLTGPSLKDYFTLSNNGFSLETIFMIETPLEKLNIFEDIHLKSIIYNNLKPSKVLTSLDFDSNILFLTDYKYARFVKDQIKKKSEVEIGKKKYLLNKFSSLNAHLGITPTMKDDLESLGYMLIYFYKKGNLFNLSPPSETKTTTNTINLNSQNVLNVMPSLSQKPAKHQRINLYLQYKLNFIPEAVFGEESPLCFIEYFNYLKYLPHGAIPEYRLLKSLFKNYLKSIKFDPGKFKYDWVQIMLNENVNLGNLSLTLTRANVDVPFSLKKDKSLKEKADNENNPSLLIPNDLVNEEPEEAKLLKLEPASAKIVPSRRKSTSKPKTSQFENGAKSESKSNIDTLLNEKVKLSEEKNNGKIFAKSPTIKDKINNNEKADKAARNGVMNGNGIHHTAENPENFTEVMLNEGKRLSEQTAKIFEVDWEGQEDAKSDGLKSSKQRVSRFERNC